MLTLNNNKKRLNKLKTNHNYIQKFSSFTLRTRIIQPIAITIKPININIAEFIPNPAIPSIIPTRPRIIEINNVIDFGGVVLIVCIPLFNYF